jgi:hypothetical protein
LRETDPLPTALAQDDPGSATLVHCALAPPGAARFAGLALAQADPETIARFDRLAPGLGIPNLADFDSSGLRSAGLPLLPGALLLLLPSRNGALSVPFVLSGETLELAARTIDWIYPLIADRPLDLSVGETATAALFDYVRFYLALLRTGEGLANSAIERPEQIHWLPEAPRSERERVGALVGPMIRLDRNPDRESEAATVRLVILHGRFLYRATLKVSPEGLIEMTDDETLAQDLPIAAGPAAELTVCE